MEKKRWHNLRLAAALGAIVVVWYLLAMFMVMGS